MEQSSESHLQWHLLLLLCWLSSKALTLCLYFQKMLRTTVHKGSEIREFLPSQPTDALRGVLGENGGGQGWIQGARFCV